jgi:hypothetical protein
VNAVEQARDAGMANALRAARVAGWKHDANVWLADQLVGKTFTADDLVAAIDRPDAIERGGNNVVGAWIAAQAKRGRIEWTGHYLKSQRVEGHGNLQRVWRKRSLDEATAHTGQAPSAVASSSERGRVQVSADADSSECDGGRVRSPHEQLSLEAA